MDITIAVFYNINMEQKKKQFQPQSKEYEIALLQKGDPEFKELKEHLIPLIKSALNHFIMSKETYNQLYKEILEDVSVAAKRFLKSGRQDKDYKFSAYYTWYISQRIEQAGDKVTKIKK